MNPSIDYALISRMLSDNLDIAKSMLAIGNLTMCQAALEMCVNQAKQLRALERPTPDRAALTIEA